MNTPILPPDLRAYIESFDPDPVDDNALWIGWVWARYDREYPEGTPQQLEILVSGLPPGSCWKDVVNMRDVPARLFGGLDQP